MAQIVKLKRTSVAGRTPTTSNIEVGELAFNSNDKSLFIRGDSNAIVAIHDESTLHIDTTNNRIGIGTASPIEPLHIVNSDPKIRLQDSDGTNQFATIFQNGGQLVLQARNNTNNGFISFNGHNGTTGTEFARFNMSGNFGIGTTSPGSKLTVEGDIRQTAGDLLYSGGGNYNIKHLVNDQNITFDTTTGGTTSERMRITSTGTVVIGTSSVQDGAHFQHYQSAARHQSFQSTNGDLAIVTDNNTNPAFYIKGTGTADLVNIFDNTTEVFTILDGGRVGIGTSSPGATLEVNGTVRADLIQTTTNSMSTFSYLSLDTDTGSSSGTNNVTLASVNNMDFLIDTNYNSTTSAFVFGTDANSMSSATELMRLNESGNLGIGTGSPQDKLNIHNSATDANVGIKITRGSQTHGLRLGVNDSHAFLWTTESQNLAFATSNAERMTITSGGYVGIGTTSPVQKLQVDGSIYSNGGEIFVNGNKGITAVGNLIFKAYDGSNYFEGMRLTSTGNVGIGTASPTGAKLHVVGAIKGTDLIAHDNTGINLQTDEGTKRLVVADSGVITFNQAYSFPTSDGSANQVLQTDGSGNLSFATVQAGGGGTVSESFKNIAVSGQSNIVADAATDTLTFAAGAGMTITTNASSDTVTFSAGTDFQDSDGDTKIQVEESSDEDIIRFDTAGTERMTIGSNGAITATGPSITYISNTDSNVGLLIRDETYASNEADITATRLASGSSLTLGLAGQDGINFYSSGVNKMKLTAAGNLGIGTTTPAFTLDVTGSFRAISDAYLQGDLYVNDKIRHNGDVDNYISFPAADTQTFVTANSERMRINSSGNVGIGTSSPAGLLHVSSGTSGDAKIIIEADTDNNAEGDNPRLEFRQDAALVSASVSLEGTAGDTAVGTIDNTLLLDSKGNLGSQGIQFATGGRAAAQSGGETASTVRMTVLGNGNIGIGTAAPNQGLHLASKNIYLQAGSLLMTQGTAYFMNASNGAQKHGFHSTGYAFEGINVGIGTTAPSTKLEVSSGGADITTIKASYNSTNYLEFAHNRINAVSSGGNDSILFQTAGTTRAIINQSGNVGIGTTAPGQKLTVAGGVESQAGQGSVAFYSTTAGSYNQQNGASGTAWAYGATGGNSAPNTAASTTFGFHHWNGSAWSNPLNINTSGNIGIGTTTPNTYTNQKVLTINGTTHGRIDFETGGTLRGSVYGDSGSLNLDAGGNYLRFYTGNTQKMTLLANGNLGIGTSSPSDELTIRSTQFATTTLSIGDNSDRFRIGYLHASGLSSGLAAAQLGSDAYSDLSIAAPSNAASEIKFFTNASSGTPQQRATIDSSGNVGIGTTDPNQLLHVNGNFRIGPYYSANDRDGFLFTPGGVLNTIQANNENTNFDNNQGNIHIRTGNNSSVAPTERISVLSTGNVGIGETNPQALLHVTKATGGTSGTVIAAGTDAGILLQDSSSPSANYFVSKIHSPGNGNAIGGIKFAVSPDNANFSWAGIKAFTSASADADILAFYTSAGNTSGDSSTERMRIDHSGNVGIGTTSPSSKLDVVGHIEAGSFEFNALSGTAVHGTGLRVPASQTMALHTNSAERMRITSAGNVGIGNTSPGFKLTVGGGIGANQSTAYASMTGQLGFGNDYSDTQRGPNKIVLQNDGSWIAGLGISNNSTDFYSGGNFTFSTGTSLGTERMRIDASGNFMVGKTTQGLANAGFEIAQTGQATATQSGASALRLNRLTSDGEILQFRKASATVGNIATVDGDLTIFSSASGHKGLRFGNGYIAPTANSTAVEDNTVDLGLSTYRFKDLHLAGTANVGGNLVVTGNLTVNGTSTTLNVATLDVEDKNITLNKGSGDTSSTADGAGITIQDAVNSNTDASLTWNAAGDKFIFSHKLRMFGQFELPDNVKLIAGDSEDLQIYHDGSNSYINETGTGDLIIKGGNDIVFQDAVGNILANMNQSNSVELMFGGSKKFETTNEGVEINDTYDISSGNTTTSATTQVTIDQFTATAFRSCRYTVQVSNTTDTEFHTTELLLVHDGTTPGITEFGSIFTGAAAEATFDADISSGNVRLRATPASADSMTFKVVRHAITA